MTTQPEEKAERIRVLLQDKSARDGTTYAQRAATDVDLNPGGRIPQSATVQISDPRTGDIGADIVPLDQRP